ncbi:unnamed protein product [Clavelina lepadiformis]|uniref:ATP-dependent RNA helicase n=1 Tax=Clavelina lepadiformis TaxID=159417 RepID=A0ABP0GHE5_CLALP
MSIIINYIYIMATKDEKMDFLKWKNNKRRKQTQSKVSRPIVKKSWQIEAEKIENLETLYTDFDSSKADVFEDFPLSTKTKAALRKHGFTKPTAIQKASILPALKGKDVLGAAKTGSGKTLAFLIPILECLYRHRWNSLDGPGALIISPTRELALQIFEVLCKVGCKHDFSAGLVIGGKDLKEEAERVCRTNVVVCTPGRLLQHLDTTSYFKLENLKILVLDEADRILDLGFSTTINAILENLPSERQTLLFSATQTKSVKNLARLSLCYPVYISVHAESRHSTPSGLKQRYVTCQVSDKINMLYSFIRNHVKTKTLVFVSSCKQVQYLFAVLCRLRPGVPIMHLHGRMNQPRRMAVYQEFCRKKFALLVATDIAARGLDFPAVDWVVQMDCPEDVDTYIHRVGRTARFHGSGNALLMLLPSEKDAMIQQLTSKKVPVLKSEINIDKLTKVDGRLQSYCAEDQELKEKAKRCFVAYIKSVHLMKNKAIFVVKDLPLNDYATSLGLAFPPRVRFLQRSMAKSKTASTDAKRSIDDKPETVKDSTKSEKAADTFDISDDEGNDLFSVKRDTTNITDDEEEQEEDLNLPDAKDENKKRSKAKEAKRLLRKGVKINQKITFDEEGGVDESWPPVEGAALNEVESEVEEKDAGGIDINKAKVEMQQRDVKDREKHRKKIAAKHKEVRLKAKEERRKAQRQKEQNKYRDNEDDHSEQSYSSGPDNDPEVDGDNEMQPIEVVGSSSVEDNDSSSPKKKRRKIEPEDFIKTNEDCLANLNTGMTLQEEENLVLHLLRKKQ